MSPEDAKIIFGNISELAIFADTLTQNLEKALGAVVEGGQGQDAVGSLFLDIVCDLEKPYKQYITRHPSAMQHLTNLPQTPALTAYLTYTQSVASSLSHAWDLSSLLIKPVQRLLKYPLLLSAIIEETPDTHPDKENLRNARIKLEDVARNVNEERRRAEVVKDVLMSKKGGKPATGVGVAAQVNLSKIKGFRHGGVRAIALAEAAESNGTAAAAAVTGGDHVASSAEAVLVEQMHTELKRIDAFAQQFAKNVVDWSKMMSHVMVALRIWTIDFGKVIGLTPDQGFGSEAFDAFLEVVERQLMPLAVELEATINERLLKDMAHLLTTMNKPLKLLSSMNEQEPYHYHLLTMPVSAKNRPPPSLLAASTNYLALRGQLAAELPTYLRLLHQGFDGFVLRLAEIQTSFWGHVREKWGVLWEMLRVEGELNAGWEETVGVWMTRWGDVDEVMKSVGILKSGRVSLDGQVRRRKSGDKEHGITPAALYQQQYQQQQQQYHPSPSRASSINSSISPKVVTVQAVMSALDPIHTSLPQRRRGSSPTGRSRGGSDAYLYAGNTSRISRGSSVAGSVRGGASFVGSTREGGREGANRGSSQDSLRKRHKDGKRRAPQQPLRDIGAGRYSIDMEDGYVDVGIGNSPPPAYETKRHGLQRMKSMPLHSQSPSQSHIHPYTRIPHPQSLNTKSSLNSDKSSLLTISTSTSTTTTTATLTNSTTTIGVGLARTGRDVEPEPEGEGGEGGPNAMYRPAAEDEYDEYALYLAMRDQEMTREKELELELERGKDKERGRKLEPPTITPTPLPPMPPPKFVNERPSSSSLPVSNNSKRKSRERSTHTRKRSGSVKSITSFFTSSLTGSSSSQPLPSFTTSSSEPPPLPFRDSWCTKPAKYICQVIHPCTPPSAISYYSFPFFTLREGELLEVLQEAGHPSIHPKLPLWVDDGEDCLLLCRERVEGVEGIGEDGEGAGGNVGWALASFLEPLLLESG
jgi:RhoGEF domain